MRGLRGCTGPRGPRGYRGPSGGGCACPCRGNILLNPSFDDFTPTTMLDLPANWNTNFNAADIVPPANDGDIHTGDGSVVFQFTGGRTQGDIYQDVTATKNCCYSLELWAKGSGTSMSASLAYLSAANITLRTDSLTVHGSSLDSSSWTSYHIQGTPSPSGTQKIRARVVVNGSGKTVRLDDMILTVAGCGGADPA